MISLSLSVLPPNDDNLFPTAPNPEDAISVPVPLTVGLLTSVTVLVLLLPRLLL
jgi:hypothetical protein